MNVTRTKDLDNRSVIGLAVAVLDPAAEIKVLDNGAEAPEFGSLHAAARLLGSRRHVAGNNTALLLVGVLNLEDGLAGLNELGKGAALAVLSTLLVDGEVDILEDIVDQVAGILETNGHVVLAGFSGKKLHVVNSALLSQAETIVVLLCQVS